MCESFPTFQIIQYVVMFNYCYNKDSNKYMSTYNNLVAEDSELEHVRITFICGLISIHYKIMSMII